jgi:uncharacterized protein YkwD
MILISRRVLMITAPAALLARGARADGESRERVAELLIAEGVNRGRVKIAPELSPLESDPMLDEIARERSVDMAHGAPFDHKDEYGAYPAIDKMKARYQRYGAMGENIVEDFDPSGWVFDPKVFAGRAVKSWFESEDHRENILTAEFTRVGTGVAYSRTTGYATQVFWGPPKLRGDRIPRRS